MRIDLKVPYAEKDSAKAKGARWDMARKVWYIVDPADLAPFAQWLDGDAQTFFKQPGKKKRPEKKKYQGEFITPPGFKLLCACTTPPWEDCPHTEEQANDILKDDYGIQSPLRVV